MNNYQPERVRDFHDEREGLTVWCADDGNGNAWIEVETSDDTGVTGMVKLTAAQAAVLDSDRLNEAIPRLRGRWYWQTMGRVTTAHGLAGQIASIEKSREPVVPQPTAEERAAARRAREERINTADQAVRKAQDVVDWRERYLRIATDLDNQLSQARALDAGLDLSALEEEHRENAKYAALLPGARKALSEARDELAAAKAWDGYAHD